MEILTQFFIMSVGLLVLLMGGELLVRGSVSLAERLKLSKVLIGAVVMGFGSSSPELMVSLGANLNDKPAIAVGNVFGSNICNLLLVLGVGALLMPLRGDWPTLKWEMTLMVGATLLLAIFTWLGGIERWQAALMLVVLAGYIVKSYMKDKRLQALAVKEADFTHEIAASEPNLLKAILFCLGGLAGLIGGAHLLVDSGAALARTFGVSEAIIALTLIAFGTSLPELAATIIAAIRKQHDLALANLLGSNGFNVLMILGFSALLKPLEISTEFLTRDLSFVVVSALLVVAMLSISKAIGRLGGLGLVALYGFYLYILTTGVIS